MCLIDNREQIEIIVIHDIINISNIAINTVMFFCHHG
jgi:hypothetical protein